MLYPLKATGYTFRGSSSDVFSFATDLIFESPLKGKKNMLPLKQILFSGVDPILEEIWQPGRKTIGHKNCHHFKKWRKTYTLNTIKILFGILI